MFRFTNTLSATFSSSFRVSAVFAALAFLICGSVNARAGFLYVVNDNTSGNQIYGYSVNEQTGALVALAGFPVASGSTFTDALVFNGGGNLLFAANGDSRNLTTYNANPTTGVLTDSNTQALNTRGAAGRLTGIDYLPTVTPFVKDWGYNAFGQLGLGNTTSPQTTPQTVTGFPDVTAFGGGFEHSVALRSNGTVIASGRNIEGQLGDGTNTNRSTFAQVLAAAGGANLSNVVAVSGGGYNTVALKSDGTVWAWGFGGFGQLGNGTSVSSSSIPVQVGSGVVGFNGQVVAVDAGFYHNLALTADGKVWAWGYNVNGQLGDGTQRNRNLPQPVLVAAGGAQLSGIAQVSAGEQHSTALKTDGSVVVWGHNQFGQVGNNTTASPVLFPTATAASMGVVTSISAGAFHTVALKANGTVWAWGLGGSGQIGDNNTANALEPRPTSISNVVDIRTNSDYHTLARTTDGSVFVWGANSFGAIGNGTTTNSTLPLNISLAQGTGGNLGTGVTVIGTGTFSSFAAVPQITVQTGENVRIEGDNVRLIYPNVTATGNLEIRAIDPSATGLTVRAGYTILANSQGYDITSTATFAGTASVCLKVATVIDPIDFGKLYILHDDDDDGTFDAGSNTRNYPKREVCRTTTSFSPFVLAVGPAQPTAALVSISGRVITPRVLGLVNALVTLTDSNGISRTVITGKLGSFRFADVRAGETYIISVSARRYTYTPQVVTVNEDLDDIIFTPLQ